MRKSIATAVVAMAALGSTVVSAEAAPPAPANNSAAVKYTAKATPESTMITTDAGSMAIEDGKFEIKAADGKVLAGTELSFRVDDFVFPIDARIDGRHATLTPLLDMAHAEFRPVSLPFEDEAPFKTQYDREQAAFGRMSTTILMGATLGSLIGGLGGAAVGCVLGGIAGATIASATIIGLFGPFIPAAAVGCLGGIIAAGALGTVAGELLVAAPIAVMAAVQYFTTINAPAPHQ